MEISISKISLYLADGAPKLSQNKFISLKLTIPIPLPRALLIASLAA